ncbi:Crp/Fnr family transcriptional regulator [Bacillus sp. Hm123]|uniref:Crp/Fnr family transcriptional regulator n=1 Tax=Bacillus sp. Hm123 TaxID=3450745 RepID=UPI003F4278DF
MKIQLISNYVESNKKIYEMLKYCPYEILKSWCVEHFESGSKIFHQGEVYNTFSIIVEGLANIYVVAENGKKYVQTTYQTGDMIGELEIFHQQAFMSNVEAVTDVTIISLKRDDFLEWLKLDQNFNHYFIQKTVELSYTITKKDENHKLYSLQDLICKNLIEQIPKGRRGPEGIAVTIDKHELSEKLAVTQRSINRVLSSLKEKKIIDIQNHVVIIRDQERLKHD